jgi:hypothetical protein
VNIPDAPWQHHEDDVPREQARLCYRPASTALRRARMADSPKWVRPVAVAALIWNLLGCAAYLADVTLTPADIAKMTPGEQALYAARPAWAVGATALAVWFGAAGSLGLVLRKRWSWPLLLVSLAGVVVQDAALFGLAASMIPPLAIVLQLLVLVIAIGLVMLARKGIRAGWLS